MGKPAAQRPPMPGTQMEGDDLSAWFIPIGIIVLFDAFLGGFVWMAVKDAPQRAVHNFAIGQTVEFKLNHRCAMITAETFDGYFVRMRTMDEHEATEVELQPASPECKT